MPDDQIQPPRLSRDDRAELTEIAERWSRLQPDEQRLVELAIRALADGRLTSRDAWGRFVAASINLLESLGESSPPGEPDEGRTLIS